MRSFLGRIVRDDVSAADAVRDPPDIPVEPVVPVVLEDIEPVPDIPVDPVVALFDMPEFPAAVLLVVRPIVLPVPVVELEAVPIGRVVVVDEVDPIGRVVVVPLVFGGFAG